MSLSGSVRVPESKSNFGEGVVFTLQTILSTKHLQCSLSTHNLSPRESSMYSYTTYNKANHRIVKQLA